MAVLHMLLVISFIHSTYPQPYYVASDSNGVGVNNFYDYASPTSPGFSILKMAYPVNVCTKNGNVQASSVYSLWQCSGGGGAIWGPCPYDAYDSTCSVGKAFSCSQTEATSGIPVPGTNGETCPLNTATTTTNYVQINYYCGFTTDPTPSQCPNDNVLFSAYGFTRLVTNVCVPQTNGKYLGQYLMATCNNVTAEIGIYSDPNCNTPTASSPHASYTRGCQNYAWPNSPDDTKCRFFRRVSACLVNGVNILAATKQPTSSPSSNPSIGPTKNPTIGPTKAPVSNPTTATSNPSTSPTEYPTQEPTIEPTSNPSTDPTFNPTMLPPTKSPSLSPTEDLSPDATLPDAEAVLATLDNVSMIYIVFGVLFVFYSFICLYIWFNERRKRRTLTVNFQKGADREERIAYLREKNQQRKLELQGVGAAGGYDQNNNYHQMDLHVQQNSPKPLDQQLMSEGM